MAVDVTFDDFFFLLVDAFSNQLILIIINVNFALADVYVGDWFNS
jgi:hypothetical protein